MSTDVWDLFLGLLWICVWQPSHRWFLLQSPQYIVAGSSAQASHSGASAAAVAGPPPSDCASRLTSATFATSTSSSATGVLQCLEQIGHFSPGFPGDFSSSRVAQWRQRVSRHPPSIYGCVCGCERVGVGGLDWVRCVSVASHVPRQGRTVGKIEKEVS